MPSRPPVTAAQPTSGGTAPGRAADDDVLRRAALEPDGVDERVADEAAERQRGGQRVDPQPTARRPTAPPSTKPKIVAARAETRPAGTGRSAVRAICASMSRS